MNAFFSTFHFFFFKRDFFFFSSLCLWALRLNGGKTLFTMGPTASLHSRNKPKGMNRRTCSHKNGAKSRLDREGVRHYKVRWASARRGREGWEERLTSLSQPFLIAFCMGKIGNRSNEALLFVLFFFSVSINRVYFFLSFCFTPGMT